MGDGAEAVQQILRTDIIHSEELEHSYPYDWRTNKPVFLLASEQWFFDCSAVRDKAVVCESLYVFQENGIGGGGVNFSLMSTLP